MGNKVVKKVTKVDSQIPKMKDVEYKIDKMNNVYQIKKKTKEREDEETTLNELAKDLVEMLEDVEYGKVGTSIMADQDTYNRMTNQPVPPQYAAARGDSIRNNLDTITNMTTDNRLYANMDSDKDLLKGSSEFELEDDSDSSEIHSGSNPRGLVRPDKYITDYRGDGLDYGATHSESFTGTAAIALAPAAFGVDTRKRKSKKKTKLETAMNRRRLVREYSPDFAPGNYKPGDANMMKKGGKGLQDKSLGKIDHDAKSDITAHGEWPRKQKGNLAMGTVDEDGVDGEAAGTHGSSVGKPEDGIQSHVGHDWPSKPKNRGGQTAFKGPRYTDGGMLGGSSVEEGWSPARIGTLMGESMDVQALFDQYARSVSKVTQHGFESLCEAYGQELQIDRNVMLNLMDRNRDFVFYEDMDSDGSYWVPGDEDEVESDEDGILTPEEHSELHDKLKAFCEKYGCPEDELHELCHEYAQLPMDDMDEEDFGDEDESEDEEDSEDDELGDSPEEESWDEAEGSASEGWNEGWSESEGEGTEDECWDECYDESRQVQERQISESKQKPRRK